jgi:ABC-type glycerol-3-phosphate transport system permease component
MRRFTFVGGFVVVAIVVDLPIIMTVLNSFKTTREITTSAATLPSAWRLDNYAFLLERSSFGRYMLNSLIVATGSTLGSLIPALLAGYALSRFRTRGTASFGTMLLVVEIFPVILLLIPLFLIVRNLGLINNYGSVILLMSAFLLPFSTWVARGFFDSIPRELEEAASVDGASRLQALRHIVVPISAAGVASIAVLSFINAWNDYLFASLFLRQEDMLTVPVGLQIYTQKYFSDWGNLMAAATLAMIPSVLLFLALRRYVISGTLSGATKG